MWSGDENDKNSLDDMKEEKMWEQYQYELLCQQEADRAERERERDSYKSENSATTSSEGTSFIAFALILFFISQLFSLLFLVLLGTFLLLWLCLTLACTFLILVLFLSPLLAVPSTIIIMLTNPRKRKLGNLEKILIMAILFSLALYTTVNFATIQSTFINFFNLGKDSIYWCWKPFVEFIEDSF